MNKDIRKIVKALEAAGFQVDTTNKGRITVRTASGKYVTTLSPTATESRALRNALAPLRRLGFRWPP